MFVMAWLGTVLLAECQNPLFAAYYHLVSRLRRLLGSQKYLPRFVQLYGDNLLILFRAIIFRWQKCWPMQRKWLTILVVS